MKRNPPSGLIAQLNRIKADLDAFANPESKAKFLENLDGLIARLTVLRGQLAQAPLERRISEVGPSLGQVIDFLQSAKDDHALANLISDALRSRPPKSQRVPIQIPPNLTNEQIREFLAKDLSKSELKAVAAQRGISQGKRSDEEVRRDILRALERQEGYQRLATPRV
ncbi:MAG TPA: hypothetical protein VMS17_28350 [Gemmataceae bacterium]|nr:hypothetical protein [Gemmataceae bacterium]